MERQGRSRRRRPGPAGAVAVAVVAVIGVLTLTSVPGTGSAGPASAGAAARPVRASSGTVWLCRPGQAPDPCAASRAATSVTGAGATQPVLSPPSRQSSRFDCFYVYPTVSPEPGDNADLTVQPAERAAALAPGVALLPTLPRVGSHVPSGDRGRTAQWCGAEACGARHGVYQLALGLEGLSRP